MGKLTSEDKIREFFSKLPYATFRECSDVDGCMLYSKWYNATNPDTLEIMKKMPELEVRGNEVRKQRFLPNAIAETPPPWKK